MGFCTIHIMGYEYIQNRSSSNLDQLVSHSIPLSDTLDMNEIGLLEDLEVAEAVGQRGINGRNTPAASPFFTFALRLTKLKAKGANSSNNTYLIVS